MQFIRTQERSVVDALALGELLLSRAETQGTTTIAASVMHGPAVILGAMQRTGRVIDLRACEDAGATVLRRHTTGTAAWMGGAGLILSLALPHVAAIEKDATDRTLLNRNVRPFLRAFTKAGAMAHYFGREWISLRKRPAALLGFEVTRKGAVLIEVLVGFDQSIALPDELKTLDERAVDRFMGKTPASLREVLPDARLDTFAERVIDGFVAYVGEAIVAEDITDPGVSSWTTLMGEMDPWPEGFAPTSLVRVPIGYLDVAVSQDKPAQLCLGGDVLAPRWLYEDVMTSASVPIDGATLEDMRVAVKGRTL